MIRLTGVHARAGGFALHDITLDVPAGGYALVIGPTGSGKSSLLDVIAGHLPVTAGRIELDGRDCTRLPPEARRVGVVHQAYHLFPHLTVEANIGYGLRGATRAERDARVSSLAALLGIEPLLGRTPARLSGGEQQRTALARALAPRPRILLLDEPFAALDPATRLGLRRALLALHAQEGTTTLQVTHDFDDALRLGDHVAVLADGRIAQQGRPETVFREPVSPFVAQFTGAGTVIAGTVVRATDTGDGVGAAVAASATTERPRFAATFRSGPLTFDVLAERDGPMHAVLRPDELTVHLEPPPPSSARNVVAGRVLHLERSGGAVHITVDAGVPITAAVTPASAAAMGLTVERAVWLSFKATAVHLV